MVLESGGSRWRFSRSNVFTATTMNVRTWSHRVPRTSATIVSGLRAMQKTQSVLFPAVRIVAAAMTAQSAGGNCERPFARDFKRRLVG